MLFIGSIFSSPSCSCFGVGIWMGGYYKLFNCICGHTSWLHMFYISFKKASISIEILLIILSSKPWNIKSSSTDIYSPRQEWNEIYYIFWVNNKSFPYFLYFIRIEMIRVVLSLKFCTLLKIKIKKSLFSHIFVFHLFVLCFTSFHFIVVIPILDVKYLLLLLLV